MALGIECLEVQLSPTMSSTLRPSSSFPPLLPLTYPTCILVCSSFLMAEVVYWGDIWNNIDPYSWASIGMGLAIGLSVLGAAWSV